ncbi:uncharacterized protein LOC129742940 [Uranotaenia lowii]|uniref:uncharacterized protein LOC129742940 n=1 Tax=Uranotaenia lowii TaxID=190385 RepID=UPI00247A72A9|nr:uncharacterized protein LOC129742940 [Uranotaenia lowii]
MATTVEKRLAKTELKRRNIIASIQRIEDFLHNFEPERDVNELPIRIHTLVLKMESFEEVQADYEGMDDSDAFIAANSLLRAKIEEQYFRTKGGLVSKVPPTTSNSPSQHTTQMAVNIPSVKLPTISLPTFDGDLNDWLTFHDSFNSLIHSSTEIPSIQKFQYLRSALKGDALALVESLTITSANYVVAWESLLSRYSNKYLLKKKHLQAITSFPKVICKSTSTLRAVVEDFQRHVKILQ